MLRFLGGNAACSRNVKLLSVCLTAVLAGCSGTAPKAAEPTAAETSVAQTTVTAAEKITSRSESAEITSAASAEPIATTAEAVAEPESEQVPEYVEFFLENKVHELNIQISESDWALILSDPYLKTYRRAEITIDGTTVGAGIHPRGVSSLNLGIKYGKNRLPFKIKFDAFEKGGNFLGLDELCLDNSACDASLLRQYTGAELFRSLGVDVSYTCFFNVSLNGRPHGLYVGVEAVDSSFLERSFGNHKHSLYKAEGKADLTPNMAMSAFEQKKGKDESKDDLKRLIEVLDETPLGEKGDIEDVIDVDLALKNFAANAVLHNWDDYAGEISHNYYLYMDGVFKMIPWDLNEVLLQTEAGEREGAGSGQDIITPITGYSSLAERPLVNKLLAVDEYYKKYIGYCLDAVRWLEEFKETRLDSLRELLEEYHINDPTKVYSYNSFIKQFNDSEREGLAGFIKERCEYLNARIPEILQEKEITLNDE